MSQESFATIRSWKKTRFAVASHSMLLLMQIEFTPLSRTINFPKSTATPSSVESTLPSPKIWSATRGAVSPIRQPAQLKMLFENRQNSEMSLGVDAAHFHISEAKKLPIAPDGSIPLTAQRIAELRNQNLFHPRYERRLDFKQALNDALGLFSRNVLDIEAGLFRLGEELWIFEDISEGFAQ